MSDYTTIQVSTDGRVGTIRLDRPEALNALNLTVMREVVEAMEAFDRDAGIGAIVLAVPWALEILRWLGVAYLLWFAWTSLKSAREATGLKADTQQRSLKAVILTTLALTFLNPGVYIDTVLMVGNLANQQGSDGVWPFTIGAMLGSVTWFLAIGYGARGLSRYLSRPRVWQILDVAIAVVLVVLAARLALG